jgi:hypothetical protein
MSVTYCVAENGVGCNDDKDGEDQTLVNGEEVLEIKHSVTGPIQTLSHRNSFSQHHLLPVAKIPASTTPYKRLTLQKATKQANSPKRQQKW